MRLSDKYFQSRNVESKVGEALRKVLAPEEEIKSEYRLLESGIRADYYLPKGCKNLEFPPETAIEVKLYWDYNTILRIIQWYLPLLEKKELQGLVIICKELPSFFPQDKPVVQDCEGKILVKDFDEFIKEADENKIEGTDNRRIENTRSRTNLENARDAFAGLRYTFFLGAGVSMDAKLPSWSELLRELMKQKNNSPYQRLNEANADAVSAVFGHSSIIAGRYAFDGYRKSLVGIKDPKKRRNKEEEIKKVITDRMRAALYRKDSYPSELISAIARAIKKKAPAQVITYNYDDLLEGALEKNTYDSVFDKNITRQDNRLPIYHVHGMIARDKLMPSMPVLSEREYHRLYCNLHNWANVVQLHALNSTVCFFIGFSMTDPNQRRLLEFARYEDLNSNTPDDPQHFVFLRKTPLKGEASFKVNKEHWTEMENMMGDFGLNVIWFDEFEELPRLIDYISGNVDANPRKE